MSNNCITHRKPINEREKVKGESRREKERRRDRERQIQMKNRFGYVKISICFCQPAVWTFVLIMNKITTNPKTKKWVLKPRVFTSLSYASPHS